MVPFPPFEVPKGRGASVRKGYQYQAKVEHFLRREFRNERVLAGQWLEYLDGGASHYAQPDFIVLGERSYLIEAKLSRCLDAEVQLSKQYGPLVKLLFPERAFNLVAICHNWIGPEVGLIESFQEARPDRVSWFHWRM